MSWHTLTAAEQDSLLRRPFDHFARYRLAGEVVEATTGPRSRVLDVGGGPGSLQAFLPEADVTSTDVALPGSWHAQAPDLVLADGASLPFADDAFDAVVSLDTLEHVIPASRAAFLEECARVARGYVLVVCPYGTTGVADADEALRAYVRARFGPDFPTTRILDEHLGYGHPDLDATVASLSQHGVVDVLPSGRLDRWYAGMVAFFHLMALGDDEPVEVAQRFLNRSQYAADMVEPAYRHAVLLRLDGHDGPAPAEALDPLRARAEAASRTGGADLSVLREVLAETLVGTADAARRDAAEARAALAAHGPEDDAVRARLAQAESQRDAMLADLATIEDRHEAAVRADRERLVALEAELDRLRTFEDRVAAHPVMRGKRLASRALHAAMDRLG